MLSKLGLLSALALVPGSQAFFRHNVWLEGFGMMNFTRFPGYVRVDASWDNQAYTCAGNQFKYHFHQVEAAGPADTGGHFDPRGCPGARSNYACDSNDLSTCEVGDLSGRNGMLNGESGQVSYADHWLTLEDSSSLLGRPIVVHCADGGARLVTGNLTNLGDVVDFDPITPDRPLYQATIGTGMDAAKVTFGGRRAIFEHTIGNNILNQIRDATSLSDMGLTDQAAADACGESMTAHVHEKWTHTDKTVAYGAECGADYTGGHYDPLYACGPASQYKDDPMCSCGAPYNKTTEAFDRTFPDTANYPYTACEVGDITCQFQGMFFGISQPWLNLSSGSDVYSTGTFHHSLLPVVDGLSVVWHCDGGARVMCAKLEALTDPAKPVMVAGDYSMGAIIGYEAVGGKVVAYSDGCQTQAAPMLELSYGECKTIVGGCGATNYSVKMPYFGALQGFRGNNCTGDDYVELSSSCSSMVTLCAATGGGSSPCDASALLDNAPDAGDCTPTLMSGGSCTQRGATGYTCSSSSCANGVLTPGTCTADDDSSAPFVAGAGSLAMAFLALF